MPGLHISVTDGRGRPVRGVALAGWLARAAPRTARGAVAIALVPDRTIRRLNRDYRGMDRVTDVLSFPAEGRRAGSRLPARRIARASAASRPLGDIAIATGAARRQAREQGHSVSTELRVLALHGLLHLLGYDHDSDRGQMHRIEERLRRCAGLPSGLIGRGAARPRVGRSSLS